MWCPGSCRCTWRSVERLLHDPHRYNTCLSYSAPQRLPYSARYVRLPWRLTLTRGGGTSIILCHIPIDYWSIVLSICQGMGQQWYSWIWHVDISHNNPSLTNVHFQGTLWVAYIIRLPWGNVEKWIGRFRNYLLCNDRLADTFDNLTNVTSTRGFAQRHKAVDRLWREECVVPI